MFMHVGDALRLRGDTVMRNQVPHDRVRDFEYQKQGLSSWRAWRCWFARLGGAVSSALLLKLRRFVCRG
jgi:hypothetical protein